MRRLPLAAVLLLPLTACSSGSDTADRTPVPSASPEPTTAPTVAPTATAAPTRTVPPTTAPTPTPTARTPETAPPPGSPTCQASTLTVTDADTLVLQSTREQVYTVRTSGPDCDLTGYPAVTLKGADGRPLAITYTRDGSTPKPIALSRSTSVSFSVTTARSAPCVDAATISVVLPGTTTARTADTTARACRGAVTVSPVRRLDADH